MQWYRPKDNLPKDNEEVLVRYGGIFELAVFDQSLQAFILRDGKIYKTDLINIQWLRLVTP